MTREEAIDVFDDNFTVIETHGHYTDEEIEQARQMAIKALEQEPCVEWRDVPSNEMTIEQARQAVKDLRKKLAEY